jgi:hypothetical protein
MRTERDAHVTGRLTKDGTAQPTPPLTRRIAEVGGRLGGRVAGAPGGTAPATLRPVPDQADAQAASRTVTPLRVVAAGAALVGLGWWRSRHWRRRAGSSEDARDD